MAGISELNYKNKIIFCLDISGLKLKNKPQFIKILEKRLDSLTPPQRRRAEKVIALAGKLK